MKTAKHQFHNKLREKKSDIEKTQTTKNKKETNFKRMKKKKQKNKKNKKQKTNKQILTSELNHLKDNQNNVKPPQPKLIHNKKAKQRRHRQVCHRFANYEYFKKMKAHLH